MSAALIVLVVRRARRLLLASSAEPRDVSPVQFGLWSALVGGGTVLLFAFSAPLGLAGISAGQSLPIERLDRARNGGARRDGPD